MATSPGLVATMPRSRSVAPGSTGRGGAFVRSFGPRDVLGLSNIGRFETEFWEEAHVSKELTSNIVPRPSEFTPETPVF